MVHSVKHVLLGLAVTAALIGPASTQELEKAGVSSVVNPDASSYFDPSKAKKIFAGDNIYRNQTIETNSNGQVQVLFVDRSSLTVGPNSRVVIDEFVYDPNRNASGMAMSVTKGVMRFVGGKSSKQQSVDIETPQATIGIRGGIVLVRIINGQVQAIFLYGDELTVESNTGETASVTRQGFMVTVNPDGSLDISRASDANINGILQDLQAQTDAQLADGTTINLGAIDDETIDLLANADAAGLGPLTLEELETELGIDFDRFEEIREIVEENRPDPEPDPKDDPIIILCGNC